MAEKVTIQAKYLDFADVFLEESAIVLSKQIRANKYVIELGQGNQPLYGPIYSLEPVEFKILKAYIKTNLANGFIRASKSPTAVPIFFLCKPNSSFCLLSIIKGSITLQSEIGIYYP